MACIIDMRGATDGVSETNPPTGVVTLKVRGDFAAGNRTTPIGRVSLQIRYQAGEWEDVSGSVTRETGQARFRIPVGNVIRARVSRCNGVDVEVWDES